MTQKEKTESICSIAITMEEEKKLEIIAQNSFIDQDIFFKDFLLKRYCYSNNKAGSAKFLSNDEVVVLQFCLQGECSYKSTNGKELVSFKNSEYNILFVPRGEFNFTYTDQNLDFINIYIEKEFFFRYIPSNHKLYKQKTIKKLSVFNSDNLHITPKLRNVLDDVSTCGFDGHLKTLYTKAKIIEIVALQLAQYQEEKTVPSGLSSIEVEKMNLIKELIDNNPDKSFSLAYLAREAGTNEQYLKKHFKILFGYTVFGYILSCKMQRAKNMLLSGEYLISDIAESMGYKHATHFTSAFKKFFGYLPQTLKSRKILNFFVLNELSVFDFLLTY